MNEERRPIEILLAEDSPPGDIKLTEKALERGQLANNLHVVREGLEAMAFPRQENEYAEKPRPDLILLDIDMPRMDDREVSAELKADEDLKRIPVVVLTSSEAEEDIARSYDLHANAYLTKPVAFDEFIEIINKLEQFWLEVVKLPPE